MQDDILFAGSIAENISFFDPQPDFKWIQECAEIAAIHDDILKIPMGYQSLVGDLGNILSGGQNNEFYLQEQFIKPKILFMDEATSHLDIQKEQEVNENLNKLNITKIIIAHRPETIASAERITALQNGVVVQDLLVKEINPT